MIKLEWHNRRGLRMVLGALTDYDFGYTLEETAARLKKKNDLSPNFPLLRGKVLGQSFAIL